jgi:serine protein kinase
MNQPNPLLQRIEDSVSPERWRALHWEGSFEEYLERVQEHPELARNAWQRLSDMIESHGCVPGKSGAAPRWKLFDDPHGGGEDAVYGLDAPLDQLVRTIRAGALGLGPERRVLLLHGPVGSAKSTIARILKRSLEAYSRSAEGALYSFEWVIDGVVTRSPMNQDPLLLIPQSARAEVETELNRRNRRGYRIEIRGELDPVSRFFFEQLLERHGGDWRAVMGHVRVRRLLLSERDRVGIGTFQPKDEKNQDSTELTGDLNYRKIAEYGSDSDPRAFNFDGEFQVANRGLLEFVEVLKLDVAFLYDLLGATQEHAIKPRKFAQTSIDEVILGHTNEPEYRKLASNELMEAFRDRTIKIDVPYNLAVTDETEIYRRQFARRPASARVLVPHALEMAALWAVLTRLEEPAHATLSLLQKARLYNGEDVQGFQPGQIPELKAGAPREGLGGISPRYVQDRIATCIASARGPVTPHMVLDELESGLRHHSLIGSEDTRKRYTQLVGLVREEYETIIQREVQAAITADPEELRSLCANYVDNVKAWVTREKVVDASGCECEPDERLMRSIEERMEIPETRKGDFRHELMNYIAAVRLEGGVFEYRENARLCRALESKVFEDRRDTIQLTTLVSSVVDPHAQSKIEQIRTRLMQQCGYDEATAAGILAQAAGLFARTRTKAAA